MPFLSEGYDSYDTKLKKIIKKTEQDDVTSKLLLKNQQKNHVNTFIFLKKKSS